MTRETFRDKVENICYSVILDYKNIKERIANLVEDTWASIPAVQNYRDRRFHCLLIKKAFGSFD